MKELLVYDEHTLSEIAYQMGYSNVAYLSNQFKKVTGLTPSWFKKLREQKRKSIDEVCEPENHVKQSENYITSSLATGFIFELV